MNKVILIGRLTKNPETRYSQSTTPLAVTRCGIAVRRKITKQGEAEADFFNLVAFGKTAEFFEKYGSKGRLVSVEGRMQQNTWEDKDKVKRTSYDLIIESLDFLDKKADQEQGSGEVAGFAPTISDDDDLPF